MKIKTITCHDVYNVGASLQAYALVAYLNQLGHEAEIIDYKPDYLSRHYSLLVITNPKYNIPLLREAYLLAKLPERLKARRSRRKKEYDEFTKMMLPLTAKCYHSNEELILNPPDADVFFAGSDQIWNAVYQNGRDPAFYLDFVPEGKVKASYAASFATESIPEVWRNQIQQWIRGLDNISVRESSGVRILEEMGIHGAVQVMDPVFLLSEEEWERIEKTVDSSEPYLLVYDFDQNPAIARYARQMAEKNNWKIYSILPCSYCDRCFSEEGPQAFVGLVRNAQFVVSNSFHATAFSMIFRKQFVVFNRVEKINTRMRDLMESVGIDGNIISEKNLWQEPKWIDYSQVLKQLDESVQYSKNFIDCVIKLGKLK